MNRETSGLSEIIKYPEDPVKFFKRIRQFYIPKELTMNLATVDHEFGVLNRTVIFRGWYQDEITYVTQSYTRNCKNLRENSKASITFYFPQLVFPEQSDNECFTNWQVRLLGATAVEIDDVQKLEELWMEEPLHAKIRAYVCNCGAPVEFATLKDSYNACYKEHYNQATGCDLVRPKSYVAFKFEPQIWDFYKCGDNKIADRVQYHRQSDGKWLSMHVAT